MECSPVGCTPSQQQKGLGSTMLGRGSARGMRDVSNKDKALSLEICFGIMFSIPGLAVIGIGHHINDTTCMYIGYALIGLGCFIVLVGLCMFCQRKAKEEEVEKVMKLQNEGGSYTYDDEGMTVTLVCGDRSRRPSSVLEEV